MIRSVFFPKFLGLSANASRPRLGAEGLGRRFHRGDMALGLGLGFRVGILEFGCGWVDARGPMPQYLYPKRKK